MTKAKAPAAYVWRFCPACEKDWRIEGMSANPRPRKSLRPNSGKDSTWRVCSPCKERWDVDDKVHLERQAKMGITDLELLGPMKATGTEPRPYKPQSKPEPKAMRRRSAFHKRKAERADSR